MAINPELSRFLSLMASKKPQDANAVRVYHWALELDPDNAHALNQLGRHSMAAKDFEDALEDFDEAIAIDRQPGYLINASIALMHLGRLEESLVTCDQARLLNPQLALPYVHACSVLQELGMDAESLGMIEAGLAIEPDNHELLFARSLIELRAGDTENALRDYEHRPSRIELAEKLDEIPEWKGESLEGKTILVCMEQGLGDQIQAARYLYADGLVCATVILFTRPELARLFELLADQIVTSDAEAADLQVDFWVGMGSLQKRCRDDDDDIDVAGGYLEAEAESQNYFRGLLPADGRLRVGLCWAGNPQHARDAERSIDFAKLSPLLDVPGVAFFSLQYGRAENDPRITPLVDRCHDLMDTAGAIANLDLVISVDTAILHLAGAIGTPVWGLMRKRGDPRWGEADTTTALYPSAQIFRQPESGDWESVVSNVREALERAAMCRARTPGKAIPPALEQTVDTRYGPMTFYPNDHYVGRALKLYGEYSESEAELLRAILKPGETVIEAGANIGGLTAAIADAVRIHGLVIAFEPQPDYFRLLDYNVGGWENVSVRRQALGSRITPIEIDGIELEKVHAPGWKGTGPKRMVQQTTVDALDRAPALIKIDVDGQELEILEGAEKTIERSRPFLYVENDKPEAYPDLIPWIDAHGYRMYQHFAPLYNPNNFAGYRVNVFGKIVSAMLLCVPKERYLPHGFTERFKLQRLRLERTDT